MPREPAELDSGRGVPDARGSVQGGGEDARPVRAENRRDDSVLVSAHGGEGGAPGAVPDACGAVERGGQHARAVGAEPRRRDAALAAFDPQNLDALGRIPDSDRVVEGCGQDAGSVRTEGGGDDAVSVSSEDASFLRLRERRQQRRGCLRGGFAHGAFDCQEERGSGIGGQKVGGGCGDPRAFASGGAAGRRGWSRNRRRNRRRSGRPFLERGLLLRERPFGGHAGGVFPVERPSEIKHREGQRREDEKAQGRQSAEQQPLESGEAARGPRRGPRGIRPAGARRPPRRFGGRGSGLRLRLAASAAGRPFRAEKMRGGRSAVHPHNTHSRTWRAGCLAWPETAAREGGAGLPPSRTAARRGNALLIGRCPGETPRPLRKPRARCGAASAAQGRRRVHPRRRKSQ